LSNRGLVLRVLDSLSICCCTTRSFLLLIFGYWSLPRLPPHIAHHVFRRTSFCPSNSANTATAVATHRRTPILRIRTFAILEQKEGKIVSQSLAAITAGTKLGDSITAFIAGSGVKSAADEAAKSKGVEKVIYVENGAYDKVSSLRK
jgi:hypothetical protein